MFALVRSASSISGLFTEAREVFYLRKPHRGEGCSDRVSENDTHFDFVVLCCGFFFPLTSIFIHGKYHNKSSVSCRSHPIPHSHPLRSLSPSHFPPYCSSSLTLPSVLHLSLSVPHCQCREHSCSHRPLRGNTQQTRKMTASAISFSEGLQVRQEMAIIPSTLSVLSYFLL